MNTPQNLINSLHFDSYSINEITISESVNSEGLTADNNTPLTHSEIQTPLTINNNLPSLTKHIDKPFMNMEAKISASKGYTDREISIINSKADPLIEFFETKSN